MTIQGDFPSFWEQCNKNAYVLVSGNEFLMYSNDVLTCKSDRNKNFIKLRIETSLVMMNHINKFRRMFLDKEELTMADWENMPVFGGPIAPRTTAEFEITDELIANLTEEACDLLEWFDYRPTYKYVERIVRTALERKHWLLNLMSTHPNFNPDTLQIILTPELERKIDSRVCGDFLYWARCKSDSLLEEIKYGPFSHREISYALDRLNTKKSCAKGLKDLIGPEVYDNLCIEYNRFANMLGEINYLDYEWSEILDTRVTRESYKKVNAFKRCTTKIGNNLERIAPDEVIDYCNERFENLRANYGMKTSRLVQRLCKEVGFNIKDPEFMAEYPKFCDAINPVTYRDTFVISANPIDYWTMSFGNSWASCHRIDKTNLRGVEGLYGDGCYSGGTESYLLDEVSLVTYTPDKNYPEKWAQNGHYKDNLECFAKSMRQMYHFGDRKFCQGRLYPQGNDGASDLYGQYRSIVQKVFADAWGIPNLWTKNNYMSEHMRTDNYACHYEDYFNFTSYCNMSLAQTGYSDERIVVGSKIICPHCGDEHNNEECISCCYDEDTEHCLECNTRIDDYDCVRVGDNVFCCDNCAESYGYNWVSRYQEYVWCDETFRCEYCDEYMVYDDEEAICTEDDRRFCCESCAEYAGYLYHDGEYVKAHYCEECGALVLDGEICDCELIDIDEEAM